VSWKADFCLGTSGTLHPEILGCFFQFALPSLLVTQGSPCGSWNCDGQKIAKYLLGGLDGEEFNKISAVVIQNMR